MIVIESLLKKRRDIDHIVIETSGMADPGIDMKQLAAIIDGNYLGAIVQKLWAEEALECRAQLDGVICLVDSLYGEQRLDPASPDYSIEAARQAALADLVILNKIDLVEEAARDGLRQRFKSINPLSIITETTFSRCI